MYSALIKSKIDKIFNEIENRVTIIINESNTQDEAVNTITRYVSSELATRSKSILSDMLFDLTDLLMETEYFKGNISRQNRFTEVNIRQEILSKYSFVPSKTLDYQEASRTLQALKVGGSVLVIGGALEVGRLLVSRLSFSSLSPISISLLIVVSIGAAIADYYAIEPRRSRISMRSALNSYLSQTKEQFIAWFDEVENYFNKRSEEIKSSI